jgi:integrase/recombinase XerD
MEEERKLIEAFVRYEKVRGTRSLRKIPYELAVLFSYLEEEGLRLNDFRYQDAVRFQGHLCTLKDENGSLHYASNTIFAIVFTSRCFFEFLKKEGRIITNPFYGLKPIKVRRKIPEGIPVEKKTHEFLTALRTFWKSGGTREKRYNYRVHVIAELMYSSGLRLSEAAALEEKDIDFEGRTIRVRDGKGGKERTAYLTEYACRVLRLYIENMREFVLPKKGTPWLFGVKSGRDLDRALNSRLKKAAEKCGISGFTSHKFRHTLGFHLLRRGCDMRFIQIILGHENMNTTSIYTQVEKGDLKKELDTYHPRRFRRTADGEP